MNERDIEEFIEQLYPFFLERIKKDNYFKGFVRRKNATVVSSLSEGETNIGKSVSAILPYDTTSFPVRNETGVDLVKGDLICIEYSIDLKNAVAMFKVE